MDIIYENDDTYDASIPIMCMLSQNKVEQKPSLYIPSPLNRIPDLIPDINIVRGFVEKAKERNFIMPQQIWESEVSHSFSNVVSGMAEILAYDYIPQPSKDRQSDLSKNFVAPFVAFANTELSVKGPYRALILGAGNGKDIRRLMHANNQLTSCVCVEPNIKEADKILKTYPKARVLPFSVARAIDTLLEMEPFDIIVMNMSAHYILGVPSARRFTKALPSLMKPDGLCFGSYVDIEAVKQSGLTIHLKNGHSVLYLGTESMADYDGEPATIGIAKVSMNGIVFRDPIVTTEMVYDLLALPDVPLSVNVFDGTSMLYGPDAQSGMYKRPDFMNPLRTPRRSELTFYRAIIITRNLSPNYKSMVNIAPPSLRDVMSTGLTERYASCSYNKGMLLQPYETQYVSTGAWMAEKLDGIMCKIIHSSKTLEVVMGGHKPRVVKYHGYTSPYDADFILQGEYVTETRGGKEFAHVVATDVLIAPWGKHGTFISRWRWLEHVYSLFPGKWPFVLQKWVSVDDPRCLVVMAVAKEGVVLEQLSAVAGVMKKGCGSAKYIKRVKTIDIRSGDGIVEVRVDTGEIIRDRPDKSEPNPPYVVKSIIGGVNYMDFCIFMRLKFDASCASTMAKVVRRVSSHTPLKEWSKEELVAFYHLQYDVLLESLDSNYMSLLRLEFGDMCSKSTVNVVAPVEVEAVYDNDEELCDYEEAGVRVVLPFEEKGDFITTIGVSERYVTLNDILDWQCHSSDKLDEYHQLLAREEVYAKLAREWRDQRVELVANATAQKCVY